MATKAEREERKRYTPEKIETAWQREWNATRKASFGPVQLKRFADAREVPTTTYYIHIEGTTNDPVLVDRLARELVNRLPTNRSDGKKGLRATGIEGAKLNFAHEPEQRDLRAK